MAATGIWETARVTISPLYNRPQAKALNCGLRSLEGNEDASEMRGLLQNAVHRSELKRLQNLEVKIIEKLSGPESALDLSLKNELTDLLERTREGIATAKNELKEALWKE